MNCDTSVGVKVCIKFRANVPSAPDCWIKFDGCVNQIEFSPRSSV